jgi:DNA-binding NarL/FixJ family response regulator
VTGVLVCDDAADMRAMLRDALDDGSALCVVGEAADGDDTVRLADALQPEVVLLDIGMPGPGPAEVVASVRAVAPGAAIVVLTGYGLDRLGEAAVEITAYLPKTADLGTVRRTLLRAAGAKTGGR